MKNKLIKKKDDIVEVPQCPRLGSGRDWVWVCIPPDQKYVPEDYSLAAIRKHEEEILPPPSYWLRPEYESIVFNQYTN